MAIRVAAECRDSWRTSADAVYAVLVGRWSILSLAPEGQSSGLY